MYGYFSNNNYPYPSITPTTVEIPHVNGQNGAQAYQLPCNSSILLLDDNAPIVYLVKTDSACYKTVTPYAIQEYKPEPPIDMKSLLSRVDEIERRLDESYSKSVKQSDISNRTSKVFDEYSKNGKQSNGSHSEYDDK